MSLTRIGSIGINTGIAFAGVTTIVTLNTANDALSIGATVNVGSGITLGASGDIFATGVSTFSGNVKVGTGITLSPDGDGFYTGVVTATSFKGAATNLTSIPAANLTGTLPAISAANLTNVPAANLTGTLPAISAANLTNVPAANITGTLPAISGANLTNLDASDLASGTVPTARLGSGTASSSTFLRGDSTFAAVTSTTINNNDDNRVITGSGTANTLNGESTLLFDNGRLDVTQTTSSSDAKIVVRNSNTPGSGSLRLEFQYGTGNTEGTDRFRFGYIEGFRAGGSNDGGLIFGTKPSNAGAPAERMRIDSSGRLLIATTSTSGISASGDDIIIGSIGDSTSRGITFATTADGTIRWADAGDNAMGRIQYVNSTDIMTFHTSNTQRIRLDSDGLKFGSDSAAANALDDYEEGTWTATMHDGNGSNTNLTSQDNRYTKIGRLLIVTGNITLNDTGKSGEIVLTNLPFTAGGFSQLAVGHFWVDRAGPSNDTIGGVMYATANNTSAYFVNPTGGASGGGNASQRYFQFSNWANSRPIYFSMTYQTAS